MPKEPDKLLESEVIAIVVERMKRANLDPAYIYAFQKTGMLVAESNLHLFSAADKKEWADAVAEFRKGKS
jgi:hypothetical protein